MSGGATAGDTQWPRFEVFQQSRPGAPYASVGSVHAPDAEMAMQNARDVFVRRPQTVGLWVVPAEAIISRTRQQLHEMPLPRTQTGESSEPLRTFHLFSKTSQRRSMTYVTHVAELQAGSAEEALAIVLERDDETTAFVWWVVPDEAIVRSHGEDAASMFRPAHDKDYRLPSAYHTRTMMRQVERDTRRDQDNTDSQ